MGNNRAKKGETSVIEIKNHQTSFPKLLTMGFIVIILVGTGLLMLPLSTRGQRASLITALFTSTSATCVTGLSLVDTARYWTLFGQVVIAVLMELGGLGFMTFAVMASMLIRKRVRMSTRILAQEALNLDHLSQLRVVGLIIQLSLIIQAVGALLLWCDFGPRYGFFKGLWLSIFHAISVFCNAGFDLFGNSLVNFREDPYVLIVMALLIIAGSFGFLVWEDLLTLRKHRQMSLHTHLALRTGLVLTIGSVIIYLLTEQNLHQFAGQMNGFNRFVNTVFMAITPRTAGMTTFSYTQLSTAGVALTILLMFIGGTPGSTAGGIKTTTVGLLALQTLATLRGKNEPTLAHRRFAQDNVHRALSLVFISLVILSGAIFLLAETQPLPTHDALSMITFEAVSAFGTTGISLGLTSQFNVLGKLILIALMFIGRVGIYTVMFSVFNARPTRQTYRYPKERVLIG